MSKEIKNCKLTRRSLNPTVPNFHLLGQMEEDVNVSVGLSTPETVWGQLHFKLFLTWKIHFCSFFFFVASYYYSAPFSPFLLHFEVKTIPISSWIIFPFSFAMNWWVLIYTYLKLIFKLSLENGWMDISILGQFTDIFLNILP